MLSFLNRKNRLVKTLTDEGFTLQVTAVRGTYLLQREADGVTTSVMVWGSVFFPKKKTTSTPVSV